MVEEERKVIEKEDEMIENECTNDIKAETQTKVAVAVQVQVEDECGNVTSGGDGSSSSTSASSEDEVLSSPSCNSSVDMMTTRNMYKRNRSRANTSLTALSNSNLLT